MIRLEQDSFLLAARRVHESESANFCDLVALSGLDPAVDFRHGNLKGIDIRGCNLSEFDLTGANLSGAVYSETTIFPELALDAAVLKSMVLLPDVAPIVEVMKGIEASSGDSRVGLLRLLSESYDSSYHVGTFLLRLIERSRSIVDNIDLFVAIPDDFLLENQKKIFGQASRLISSARVQAPARKKVGAKSPQKYVTQLIQWIGEVGTVEAARLAISYRRGELSLEKFAEQLKKIG